jgi:hypothetical protein
MLLMTVSAVPQDRGDLDFSSYLPTRGQVGQQGEQKDEEREDGEQPRVSQC